MVLSVVIPAKDEKENIHSLVEEIFKALKGVASFEVIYIDDGSADGTYDEVVRLKQAGFSELSVIKHARSVGQSTAVVTGVKAAKGKLIVTLDADGQNDPADIPTLLEKAQQVDINSHFCIAGYRKNRKDTAWKRFQSRFANRIRSKILDDGTPDTGCGLKIFPRSSFLQLPYFDHMHRYIPALIIRLGGQIIVVEVNHRDRQAGVSKYTMWNRLWVGIVDMMAVRWLQKRSKLAQIIERS